MYPNSKAPEIRGQSLSLKKDYKDENIHDKPKQHQSTPTVVMSSVHYSKVALQHIQIIAHFHLQFLGRYKHHISYRYFHVAWTPQNRNILICFYIIECMKRQMQFVNLCLLAMVFTLRHVSIQSFSLLFGRTTWICLLFCFELCVTMSNNQKILKE